MTFNKTIWFVWLDSEVRDEHLDCIYAWKAMNPDYRSEVVTDNSMMDSEPFLTAYNEAGDVLSKSDALRYFLLYEYGGVYVDLDTKPLRPLEKYGVEDGGARCAEYQYNGKRVKGNFFLSARKGNDLFKRLVAEANLSVYKYNLNGNPGVNEHFSGIPVNTAFSEDQNKALLFHEYNQSKAPKRKPANVVTHRPRKRSANYLINDEEYDDRQSICGGCEYLTDKEICKKCGCAGRNKSRIRSVKCPINKW